VHSPVRYAWDLQHQYLQESGLHKGIKSIFARFLLHYIRNWDARSANGVDYLIANSHFIGRRIRKAYQRESTVIYPPVDVRSIPMCAQKDDFYLTASRMVPYKRINMIVEAFSKTPERRLVVIGDGPDMQKIRALAGPNVQIMGYQPFEVLRDHMQRARAFVYAAEEDFGISIIEAQAAGTPVVTFGKGGALETVIGIPRERPTGVFFKEATPDSLIDAVDRFERNAHLFDPRDCRENAERFSTEKFRASFRAFVEVRLARFRADTEVAPAPVRTGEPVA
jgi:glycosyltransferase involved in cell wall biosynthesis